MIRAEIMASHRFHSFADQRQENFVKWCVIVRLECGCSLSNVRW